MIFSDKQKNLNVLMDECGELIQICAKIQRYGIIKRLQPLTQNLGDVIALIEIIKKDYGILDEDIHKAKNRKLDSM